jgi:hypothetical protein
VKWAWRGDDARPLRRERRTWVRKGVGAVATQASTRTEYGNELLDALAKGEGPDAALKRLLAADSGFQQRQVAVIAIDGPKCAAYRNAAQPVGGASRGQELCHAGQHPRRPTGARSRRAQLRSERGHTDASGRSSDRRDQRGFVLGGDKRHGLRTSAAVIVADARPGMSRRTDGQTVNINVCENASRSRSCVGSTTASRRHSAIAHCSSTRAAMCISSR